MTAAALLLTAAVANAPVALAANENFSVYAPTQAQADAVLRQAESLRAQLAQEWFGERLAPGVGRTLIHVRVTPAADRGRSSVIDHRSRTRSNILWIDTDSIDGDAFESTLAHELMHCLLAARFPSGFPVWGHEGCAGQYDTGLRRSLHEETVRAFARTGRWPALVELLAIEQFDPDDRTRYGAAVSVAEYLIRSHGREQLVSFAASGRQHGDWDRAVRETCALRDVAELQSRWQQWVTESQTHARRSAQAAHQRVYPKGPI